MKISHKWSKEDEEEFKIAIETLHEAGQHSSAMWLKSLKQRIVQMTYEERKRWLCQQCGWPHLCGYVNRHLEDKCTALQEKMEGWELGYQDAIDNPTGGELLHVLNKGRKIGYKEATERAVEFIYEQQLAVPNIEELINELRKYMEQQ